MGERLAVAELVRLQEIGQDVRQRGPGLQSCAPVFQADGVRLPSKDAAIDFGRQILVRG
jgi:hypothetical protein